MSVMEISETLAAGRAAQELRLKRGEFELATQMGHVRTVGGALSGRRRVARGEVERLRRAAGFPDALRERVRTVGTAEGAELMDISPGRFTRLARAGYLVPVRFYLNRYRAVVWLYLAEELRAFASGEPGLLTGRLPRSGTLTEPRGRTDRARTRRGPDAEPAEASAAGEEDCRPRNWRGRRIGLLLHESDDRWERAAIVGSVLDPVQLAELVPDPYERACLNRLRPDLAPGRPASEAARGHGAAADRRRSGRDQLAPLQPDRAAGRRPTGPAGPAPELYGSGPDGRAGTGVRFCADGRIGTGAPTGEDDRFDRFSRDVRTGCVRRPARTPVADPAADQGSGRSGGRRACRRRQ